MTKWNARTDAEWCEVMHRIQDGHRPWKGDGVHDAMDLAYYEGVWMRDFIHIKPKSTDVVLDVGCGNGRFAVTCLPYECRYIGLDPMPSCIDFCREAFAPWSDRYRFEHIDVYNRDYYPQGTVPPVDFRIPLDDSSVTYAAAISVFTHLCTEDVCEHYVSELWRVLVPSGILYTTWFKSPPNAPTDVIERTVLPEATIREMLTDAGFRWITAERGDTTEQHDQWRVWCKKPNRKGRR